MRCRSRDGPWGSHHDEARREKWETSEGETEDAEGVVGGVLECCLPCIGVRPTLLKVCVGLRGVLQADKDFCTMRDVVLKCDPLKPCAMFAKSL